MVGSVNSVQNAYLLESPGQGEQGEACLNSLTSFVEVM